MLPIVGRERLGRTLVVRFDVSGLPQDEIDQLAFEVSVQADDSDGHRGVPQPTDEIVDGDAILVALSRDEANSIAEALDTLASIDEGENTDRDELVRLRDLLLATPGVH